MTARLGYPRQYESPPPVVSGYEQDAAWYVVAPPTTTIINQVANPSIETNTTGYTAIGGTVAQSIVKQRRGAYSLLVTPAAGVNDGVFYGTVTTAASKNYPWSFDFWGNAGYKYKAYWATTGGVLVGSEVKFIAAGRWQRIQVPYFENSATTRRLYIVKDNQTNLRPFYVDGMMVLSGAEDFEEWRYFDGATLGFIPNQVDFYWNGTPHGSTSTMRPNSRAGGRIIPFSRYGLSVLAMLGLGMKTPNNVNLPLALPGGAQYQRTLAPANDFSLPSTVSGSSQQDLRSKQVALKALLDVRQQPVTQPLILQYEPLDECGQASWERTEVVCSFAGGLEGQWDNHYQENINLKFTNFLPFMAAMYGNVGAALDVRDTFTGGYIARRDSTGIWSALQTSGLNASGAALLWLPNGKLLVGGGFTNAGGVADADFLALYDPSTDAFSAVNATPLNGNVRALMLLANGDVVVGGNFTNAGGDANADFLCRLVLGTGAFSSFNATPLNAAVLALGLLPNNDIAVGGGFTNAGGDANADFLARMSGSTFAFSAFSTTPLNAGVVTINISPIGDFYLGGTFTNAGGDANADFVARLDPPNYDTFTALSTRTGFTVLSAAVNTLFTASNGLLYIGGNFTNVNGQSVWDYLAAFNGLEMQIVLGGLNQQVYTFAELPLGTLWIGGSFSTVSGVSLFDGLIELSGSTPLPIDIDFPGTTDVFAIATRKDGQVAVFFGDTGTANTSGTTTLNNPGTAPSKPIIVINHPTTATLIAPLYAIRNLTTGKVINFSLSLLIGETLIIDLTTNSVTSDLRGNLISTILPGSNVDSFYLVPGPNIINIFSSLASGSLPTAYIYWTPSYGGVADAGPL